MTRVQHALGAIGLLLLLFGAGPAALGASGGGAVENVEPRVVAFASRLVDGGGCVSDDMADRSGDDVFVVEGSVEDANGEDDITGIRVTITGATNATYEITESSTRWDVDNSPPDVTPDTSPDSSSPNAAGTKRNNVWDESGSTSDGRFRFNLFLPVTTTAAVGTLYFDAAVRDESDIYRSGPAAGTSERVGTTEVTIDLRPVQANGTLTSARWGDWRAVPGARDVDGVNVLRIRNTGDCPHPEIQASWDGPVFTGLGKPSVTLPLAGNLAYSAGQGPGQPSPADVMFGPFAEASGQDAAFAAPMPDTNTTLFLRYRILGLPTVIEDLTFRQTFTLACVTDGCREVYV